MIHFEVLAQLQFLLHNDLMHLLRVQQSALSVI